MSSKLFKTFVAPQEENNIRNSEGSVIETAGGRLLLVWWHFYAGEGADHSPGDIAARWSQDRGRTWDEKFILQENVAGQSTCSPSLLRLSSGRIAFFYGLKNASDDLPFYARLSEDEARSFGEPVLVTDEPGYWVMNNDRAVQLSSGRVLAPVCWTTDCYGSDHVPYRSTVFYSDDGCRTWRRSADWLEVDSPAGFQEPGVVELRDGRVMMFGRTDLGHPWRAYSNDGGESWSQPEPMEDIFAPCSPVCIKRIPTTGHLLMVWNNNSDTTKNHQERRTPLTVAISEDEGQTWGRVKNLEDDPTHTHGYTSITFVGENVLFTYYDSASYSIGNCSLKLCIAPLEWLYE